MEFIFPFLHAQTENKYTKTAFNHQKNKHFVIFKMYFLNMLTRKYFRQMFRCTQGKSKNEGKMPYVFEVLKIQFEKNHKNTLFSFPITLTFEKLYSF